MCEPKTHWINKAFLARLFWVLLVFLSRVCSPAAPLTQCQGSGAHGEMWEHPEMGGGITPGGQVGCHVRQERDMFFATGFDYGRHGAANCASSI